MTKKTRLIPFDWEKYKAGSLAVMLTNGEIDLDYTILSITNSNLIEKKPINVIFYYNANSVPVSSHMKTNTKGFEFYCDNSCNPKCGHDKPDLMLVEELEEKTFYVNVYSSFYIQSLIRYWSLDDAIKNRDDDSLGTLKVTYTDEDLIK